MGQVDRIRAANKRADAWLCSHPIIMYSLFVAVPLLTIVGLTAINGDPIIQRVILNGLVFGVTFAVVSFYLNQWRSTRN